MKSVPPFHVFEPFNTKPNKWLLASPQLRKSLNWVKSGFRNRHYTLVFPLSLVYFFSFFFLPTIALSVPTSLCSLVSNWRYLVPVLTSLLRHILVSVASYVDDPLLLFIPVCSCTQPHLVGVLQWVLTSHLSTLKTIKWQGWKNQKPRDRDKLLKLTQEEIENVYTRVTKEDIESGCFVLLWVPKKQTEAKISPSTLQTSQWRISVDLHIHIQKED